MSGPGRLNYNKWDSLQLSDDSDIEVHPNVDKKSMIRWKQRDIHEKRELRKLKITHLHLETKMNHGLLVRIKSLLAATIEADSKGSSAGVESFIAGQIITLREKVPNFDNPEALKDGEQPGEDHMIISLLSQVVNAVTKLIGEGKADGKSPGTSIIAEIKEHERRLVERQAQIVQEILVEEKEQKKYITSDDLHMGFESKTMISDKPSAVPQGPPKAKVTTIETINSPSYAAGQLEANSDDSEEEENAATLTPAAVRFSQIPPLDFQTAFKAISNEPSLLAEENTDALLVEAFSVAMKGEDKRARQCVEKGLLLQYCSKLGRDGVALFFRRMTSTDPKALNVFLQDVATTSKRIIDRARVVAAEQASPKEQTEREQIQLVAADESTIITFEIPTGPPPENLEITGEGSEEFDPVLVREFLKNRWDYFDSFPKNLQKALEAKNLEKVNKVLGKMTCEDAEEVVRKLQEGGMLAFESEEIVDRTGKTEDSTGKAEDEEKIIITD